MNYLVAPRNYDRDYGRPTPGFGDMDEYGLPRGMSPEDKREVLDRFPLPGSSSMFAPTQTRDDIDFKKIPDEVERRMRVYGQGSVGFGDTTPSPYIRQHDFDPVTPEQRERIRILEGRGPFPNTERLDPFSPNPLGDGLLDYLKQLERKSKFKDLLYRPTDTFDIRKPVYRPEDKVEVLPLEVSANYTTVDPSDLPEAVELRRKSEDFFQEMNPNPSIDPSKLDLREYRRPGPYVPGEDLIKDQFIRSDRSPIASNPETGARLLVSVP